MEQDKGMGLCDKDIKQEADNHDEEISHPVAEFVDYVLYCYDITQCCLSQPCDKPATSSGCTPSPTQLQPRSVSVVKQEECLTVKYIKAVDKLKLTDKNGGTAHHPKKRPSDQPVMFHVLTKGGKNVVQIMRNPELKELQEMTVYAYKGEKVKQALKRDGRLMNTVFEKNCALSNTKNEETTEMSSLVDDLNGKTFKIILLNKDSPPDSQPSSLDDAYMKPSEFQRSDSDGNQHPPHESAKTESGNDENPKENPKLDVERAQETTLREIPDSKQMLSHLSKQLKDFMKENKTQRESKPSRIQNLFRVEYGKKDRTCREVKTMKELMKLSDSVCQVRVNGKPEGSGFLLFDKFVLTNGHVVKNSCQGITRQLIKPVTVHFCFESLDHTERVQDAGVQVVQVVGSEYCYELGQERDWALLRLETDQTLPDGLLTRFGFLPQDGGICIIGHPDGGVKMIDPCWIIPICNRNQVVERHRRENPDGVVPENGHHAEHQGLIQLITHQFFNNVAVSVEYKTLTYESCFYYGSSGSPVFDADCSVIAMHTGGFPYRNAGAKMSSVVEFGHPLSVIIEQIIVQMMKEQKFDVLKNMKKELAKRPDLEVFKNAAENPDVTSDESLKAFFDFLFQREEPVPMDID
ncbi:hypothetical protein L3Q82_022381 [Scortum barcoo]|uniref:Uncharacterized protein n=1 Tax=Scortum barcoo TaxID=214431 RepID=A0ACB8X1P2_9TELE|nr:hypothetical protein L3Q82_022381 [Scortum barcoo]